MGQDESKPLVGSKSEPIVQPEEDGVAQIPTLNYSRPGLVVVSAGPEERVTQVTKQEEEKDVLLDALDQIPTFLPLVKSSVKNWEKHAATPFPLEPLSSASAKEFCRSYQDFLRKSSGLAVQEQKLISSNIKKLEIITSRTLECIATRAADMKRLEVRFRDVGILARQLNDVKTKIENTVDSLQRLNMLLPEPHRLEKLSFALNAPDSEVHKHLETCEVHGNGNTYPLSGVAAAQGRRPTMEDTHVAIDCLKGSYDHLDHIDQHLSFYAVYDGHGGTDTAIIAEKLLHDSMVQSSEFIGSNVQQAIEDAYLYTDRVILERSRDEKWRNGSTAVTVLLHGKKLFAANAGDSEAVLGRRINKDPSNLEYEPILLTKKHVPADPSERARIERAGGTVFHNRVLGSLAVSRALGDLNFKEIPMVIAAPYIFELELTEEDEFIIIACDGLWDVMTYDDAVEYVAARRQIDNISAKDVCQELIHEAITKRGSSDNVSVVVVYLKPQFS